MLGIIKGGNKAPTMTARNPLISEYSVRSSLISNMSYQFNVERKDEELMDEKKPYFVGDYLSSLITATEIESAKTTV